MSKTFLVKFYSPVCIAWNNNYPVPVCLACRRTPSIKSFVLGVIICPVLSVLKFDLRSRDEVFYLGICGSNSRAGSKSPAESKNLYEFFGDGMGLLLFQDEVTALEYKLISIVHSLITTKELIKLR